MLHLKSPQRDFKLNALAPIFSQPPVLSGEREREKEERKKERKKERKSIDYKKVPRLCPLVLLVRVK
ncbi:hypothetical protein B7P43_G10718 [Cryptotermes secundus]|uniref:Uncharacterized protein n=1 Tax=Cryptotermes secundus TaxID=105785 RepID=A0A2J7RGZ2_9NEOP|nr:hypothetical protein B7P43_G10718 [Cryptotermes secundus]